MYYKIDFIGWVYVWKYKCEWFSCEWIGLWVCYLFEGLCV